MSAASLTGGSETSRASERGRLTIQISSGFAPLSKYSGPQPRSSRHGIRSCRGVRVADFAGGCVLRRASRDLRSVSRSTLPQAVAATISGLSLLTPGSLAGGRGSLGVLGR